jgi:SagB-type dehydrogenase family enzyme
MQVFVSVVMVMAAFFLSPAPGQGGEAIKLPPPAHQGSMSVEAALKARRTVRRFGARGLELAQVSQLLWATDGVSDPRGLRTAPSAGATFPLEIYLVAGERGVAQLPAGLYRYRPLNHSLELLQKGDLRQAAARACLSQVWMAEAPVMVVFAAQFARCTARYGQRGLMYTHMEAGHAGQNLFLQAEALGLGAGIVGAFEDKGLSQVLKLPADHAPLLVMPVGYKH